MSIAAILKAEMQKALAGVATAEQVALATTIAEDVMTNSAHASEYEQVARALGFTEKEISALVGCNDAGLSFAQIAELIDQHPPVYSSVMTARRVAEEYDFILRCHRLVVEHRQGLVSHHKHGKQWKQWSYHDPFTTVIVKVDTGANAFVDLKNAPGSIIKVDNQDDLHAHGIDGSLTEPMAKDSKIWLPFVQGQYHHESTAAQLGIWTPGPSGGDGWYSYYTLKPTWTGEATLCTT